MPLLLFSDYVMRYFLCDCIHTSFKLCGAILAQADILKDQSAKAMAKTLCNSVDFGCVVW